MKKQNGITLIALVISIIVMLILAGISINAVVGDNGLLTKAQEAKLTSEEALRRENLELLIFDYNTSKFLNKRDGLNKYLENLVEIGEIESFAATTDGDYSIIKYKGKIYEVVRQSEDSEYYKVIAEVTEDLGDIDGNYILTQKTLNTVDNFKFEDKKSYIIKDEKLTGDDFEFNIPANSEVTIKVLYDMVIDNKGFKRSAIDLGDGATLNLYVYGKVEVNSGYGEEGETNTGTMAKGGPGGYAGIHVPESATLNLYGTGMLISIGGDAGDGGSAISSDAGGAGGGGAGAGIGGHGGAGGNSNLYTGIWGDKVFTQSGADGKSGENCGTINIYNTLEVYAYGGAGASGGKYVTESGSSGTGGGGYPAAGIGGGGAGAGGADHMNGGGGYSCGVGELCSNDTQAHNGMEPNEPEVYSVTCSGGSYFSEHKYDNSAGNGCFGGKIGGQGGNYFSWWSDSAGDGGVAGKGGNVKVSSMAIVNAYNGNKYSDGTDYQSGINQVDIFAQSGILREVYKLNCWWGEKENYSYDYFYTLFGETIADNVDEIEEAMTSSERYNYIIRQEKTCLTTSYLNPTTNNNQGIGSGAGYIELSNGTYTVDTTMN